MFYKHDRQKSTQEHNQRVKDVELLFKRYTDEWFAELQILLLDHISWRGLPDCYKSFKDFLYDFYPSFSWNERAGDEMEIVVKDVRFDAISERIKKLFDFDIKHELTVTLKEVYQKEV